MTESKVRDDLDQDRAPEHVAKNAAMFAWSSAALLIAVLILLGIGLGQSIGLW